MNDAPAKSEPQVRQWKIYFIEGMLDALYCEREFDSLPELDEGDEELVHVIEKSAYDDLLVKYKKVSLEREECYATLDSIAFVEHAYPDVSANKLADHARVTLRKFPGLHIDSDSSVQKLHMDSKSELQARECVAELVTTDEGQRWLHAFGSMSAATRYGACARQEFIPMIEKSAYEALRAENQKLQIYKTLSEIKYRHVEGGCGACVHEIETLRAQLAEAKVQVDVSNHNRKIIQLQEQLTTEKAKVARLVSCLERIETEDNGWAGFEAAKTLAALGEGEDL